MVPSKTLSGLTVERAEQAALEKLGVFQWPLWTKEPSTFDWHYAERERCLFLAGDVTVKTAAGEISFGQGDFVTFPRGLDCVWHVKKTVRKHYNFG